MMKTKEAEKFVVVYEATNTCDESGHYLGATQVNILTIKQITDWYITNGIKPLSINRIGEEVKLTLDIRP